MKMTAMFMGMKILMARESKRLEGANMIGANNYGLRKSNIDRPIVKECKKNEN